MGVDLILHFKTSLQTGLIVVARLDNQDGSNAGYYAVGIDDGKLVSHIAEGGNLTRMQLHGRLVGSAWHRLAFRLLQNDSSVRLSEIGRTYLLTHTFSSNLAVRDVFLGGANSFFGRVFTTLNVTEYFTGCFANATFNGREVNFAPRLKGYGMEYGCCPDPEPVVWCFKMRHQFLNFTTRLSHTRFSADYLRISFRIRATEDGMVLYSQVTEGSISALAIELFRGYLHVSLANTARHFQPHTLSCNGSRITESWWHRVEFTIRLSSIHCVIDGIQSKVEGFTLNSLPRLPTASPGYHIGSTSVSHPTLVLFQAELKTFPDNGLFPSFLGCLQKFQLNGIDLSPPALLPNAPSLLGACPSFPQPPLSTVCQLIQQELDFQQISVETSNVTVDEDGSKVLTVTNFLLVTPAPLSSQDVRNAVQSSINFHVVGQPKHGQLVQVQQPHRPVYQFSYLDVVNGRVMYRHNGDEEALDVATLQIRNNCSRELVTNIVVNFTVNPINDLPVVAQLSSISIAVGTRRVITSDIVTVSDAEASSHVDISFHVNEITATGCESCPSSPAGRIERASQPGLGYSDFNQDEVNHEEMAFQHFAKFGVNPVNIHLRASDKQGTSINLAITVVPYIGHLNLTLNLPLSVGQGMCAILLPQHLNADFDFDDQNPIIQYQVTSVPVHGRLEIYSQEFWIPLQGPASDLNGFTQSDINGSFVRYCHNNNTLSEMDRFQFQLHSTELSAGNSTFRIAIIPYSEVPRPRVVLRVTTLHTTEGGRATLQKETLAVSFAEPVTVPRTTQQVSIEELGITFSINRPPTFGSILVNESPSLIFSLSDLKDGAVSYEHSSSEDHRDFLTLTLAPGAITYLTIKPPILPNPTNLSIEIAAINNHSPTILTSSLTLGEGRFVLLDASMLNIVDEDQPQQTIHITLVNQDEGYGFFTFNSNGTAPIETFTLADVQNRRVSFVHHLDIARSLAYIMRFVASDGERMTQGVSKNTHTHTYCTLLVYSYLIIDFLYLGTFYAASVQYLLSK